MSGLDRTAGELIEAADSARAALLARLDDGESRLPVDPVVVGGVAVLLGGLVAWWVNAPRGVVGVLQRGLVGSRPEEPGALVRSASLALALLPVTLGATAAALRDRRALFVAVLSVLPSTLLLFLVYVAVPELIAPALGIQTTSGFAVSTRPDLVRVPPPGVRLPPAIATLGSVVVAVAALNVPAVRGEESEGDGHSWAGLTPASSAAVAGAVALLVLVGSSLTGGEPLWVGVTGAGLALATGAVTRSATGSRLAAVAAAALGAVPGVIALATLDRSVTLGVGVGVVVAAGVAVGAVVARLR